MQSRPPETKYEINASELLTAMKSGAFEERPWFYTATRAAIEQDADIASYGRWLPDDEKLEYIVLKGAICKVSQNERLLLEKIGGGDKKGFLFYKCILPEIIVRESATLDWLIIHTYIHRITIEPNSRVGAINIRDNSLTGDITISDNSVANRIKITQYSKVGIIGIYDNGQCGNIDISKYSESDHIYLVDSQTKDILASDNSKTGILDIRGSKIRNIKVENSETGIVSISDSSQSNGLFVLDNSRTGRVIIGNNSKISRLIFIKSKSINIEVSAGSQCENLAIARNSHVGTLEVTGGQVKDTFIEYNCCSIHLLDATIPIMRIDRCHLDELKWQASTRGELYITDSLINHLNLNNTALTRDAVLSVSNCSIHIIQLQELIVQGMLILRHINTTKELFTWQPDADQDMKENADSNLPFSVEQQLYRHHSDFIERLQTRFKKRPLFLIANSSLGKTEITGSDLELFRLEYRDSRLLEVFISGTKLPPTNIYCPTDDPLPPRDLFEQKVAIYNQLKRIFDNQGDIVEATQYHARAMDSQKNLLKLIYREKHAPKWYSVNKWFTDEGFDLFGFRLNRLSNNHGESWRRALGFTIGISLFLYTCYFISLNYYKDFFITWKTFGDFIGNYFSFLDLTHRIDFMVDKSELNATAQFLDFIGRVAIGYGIYQFVAAFRRHVRK